MPGFPAGNKNMKHVYQLNPVIRSTVWGVTEMKDKSGKEI
ncbi:unnamed protein product, partial [marine sediment metagenome]